MYPRLASETLVYEKLLLHPSSLFFPPKSFFCPFPFPHSATLPCLPLPLLAYLHILPLSLSLSPPHLHPSLSFSRPPPSANSLCFHHPCLPRSLPLRPLCFSRFMLFCFSHSLQLFLYQFLHLFSSSFYLSLPSASPHNC